MLPALQLGIDALGAKKLAKSAILSAAGIGTLTLLNSQGLVPADWKNNPEQALLYGAAIANAVTWIVNFIRKLIVKYPSTI